MKKLVLLFAFASVCTVSFTQNVTQRLTRAWKTFEQDSQMRNGIASLYVVDAGGKVVFDKNGRIGLAPASTQKVITAASAYEVLGTEFRYQTQIGYDIGVRDGALLGNLYIDGSGDPTLGSWRWQQTRDTAVLARIAAILRRNGVQRVNGDIWINDLRHGINPVPDGWIWQDIGNYYGAGSWGLNWRENQYDLVFKPSPSVGSPAEVVRTVPLLYDFHLANMMKTGKKGSGDNGYIYYAPNSGRGFATGTIPQGSDEFSISGSIPHPVKQFGQTLSHYLASVNIPIAGRTAIHSDSVLRGGSVRKMMLLFDSIASPSLDSMVYFFLRRSINLYGESFIKEIGLRRTNKGDTDEGADAIRAMWKNRGILPTELNMVDGSGLSPLNRVTTHAQVEVLRHVRSQSWFAPFYDALPEFNGMKMKSGTISGAKAFCGYHTSKDGKTYIFSFIVNNYNGSASSIVRKMYAVLDELK